MIIKLEIENVQHIASLNYEINLADNKLTCIVGKNGSGKTTLIRAIQSIKSANTFSSTASPYIFNKDSKITYTIDKTVHVHTYNENFQQLDSKTVIESEIQDSLFVEQPIPHGIRFNHAQKLSNIDEALRRSLSLESYSKPSALIDFLHRIYTDNRFENLKEVEINSEKYYFIPKNDNFYIREDYFSSGEYFILHLYKLVHKNCKLIVIDELDISLDSAAQVHLIRELRELCTKKKINIVFTTHSSALMRTLEDNELFYMDNNSGTVSIDSVSYNYVRSILFGFTGWDKYILVEDERLEEYLSYLLRDQKTFFSYKIIYIGGGSQVVDLLKRNSTDGFLATQENVIAVLDGDQKNEKYCRRRTDTFFIPAESIEKEIAALYRAGHLGFTVNVTGAVKNFAKNLFTQIIRENHMTRSDMYGLVNGCYVDEVNVLTDKLVDFLNPKKSDQSYS